MAVIVRAVGSYVGWERAGHGVFQKEMGCHTCHNALKMEFSGDVLVC